MAIDPLTRRATEIVGGRQSRPNLPVDGCPFCPGGLEAPEDYDVRWFTNRFPPLPEDRCELVLYTSDHHADLWSLGHAAVRRVVDLWAERTAALGARDDVGYVLVFENRGPEVGATITHPHGQIYALTEVPPEPLRELVDGVLIVADHMTDDTGRDLVVSRAGDWVAWSPAASSWPFELLVAPRTAVGALDDPGCDRDGLATVLIDVLARLDQLFASPMPYMMWMHQRPTDGAEWAGARLHVHIAPRNRSAGTPRFVAAAEVGSGMYFNPVPPADAAALLRDLAGHG